MARTASLFREHAPTYGFAGVFIGGGPQLLALIVEIGETVGRAVTVIQLQSDQGTVAEATVQGSARLKKGAVAGVVADVDGAQDQEARRVTP